MLNIFTKVKPYQLVFKRYYPCSSLGDPTPVKPNTLKETNNLHYLLENIKINYNLVPQNSKEINRLYK